VRCGYVSIEGWAGLACWAVVLILFGSTGGKLSCERVPSGDVRHHDIHQKPGPLRQARNAGAGPARATTDQQSMPPCSPVPAAAIGIFGLAAIVLTARWAKNRFWLARTRLRSEAWYEGRAKARRKFQG
jgi:hypothetical protein